MNDILNKMAWLGFGIVFLGTSCTGINITGSSVGVPEELANIFPSPETADAGCSYFYYLWAKSAELEGSYDEALEGYEKALICDPGADRVRVELAILLLRMNKKARAVEMLESMASKRPQDVETRMLLGKIYSSTDEYDNAVAAFQWVLNQQPEHLEALLLLGTLHARHRDYEKAQKVLKKLVEVSPRSFAGYFSLARLYRELRFFDDAVAAYKNALDINPSSDLKLELAKLYEQKKNDAAALSLYREIMTEDENYEEAANSLISLLLSRNRVSEALVELQKLRGQTGNPAEAILLISRIYLSQKRFDDAMFELTSFLQEQPEATEAWYLLAHTYLGKGDKVKAKEILANIPTSAEVYPEVRLQLAEILREEGNTPEAERILRQEIESGSSSAINFYLALAALYEGQEKFDLAEGVLLEAREKFPAETKVIFSHGILLDKKGDTKGALAKMEEVLRLEPDNPYALNYVGYTWADQGIRLDEALRYIARAVELRPDDGYIRDSLGWVYFKRKEFSRAVAELEQAIAMVKSDATIHEHLGDAYREIGEREKALAQYEQARELAGDEKKKAVVTKKIEELQRSLLPQ